MWLRFFGTLFVGCNCRRCNVLLPHHGVGCVGGL